MDPRPFSMRRLWWLACGRYELQVRAEVFWSRALGGKPTPEQVRRMHPLRGLERQPEPTPEQAKAESDRAFHFIGAMLKAADRRGG